MSLPTRSANGELKFPCGSNLMYLLIHCCLACVARNTYDLDDPSAAPCLTDISCVFGRLCGLLAAKGGQRTSGYEATSR